VLDDLHSRVIEAIAKFKKIPAERITLDSTFEELGIDSLDGLEFFFELEGELGIAIPDARLRNLRTVRQTVEEIEQLVSGVK
jgi:acyl carrier protein